MDPGEVCCGAAGVEWLEIGRPLMTSLSAASAAACCDAALQMETNTETETMGWNWKVKEMVTVETESCRQGEGMTLTDASCV